VPVHTPGLLFRARRWWRAPSLIAASLTAVFTAPLPFTGLWDDTAAAARSAGPVKSLLAEPVAATVFVATGGADANPCTRALPCRTFDRAYRVARPGQVIEIAAGSYPSQTIRVDRTKVSATRNVVFRPATGGTVQINGDLVMYGSHAVFRGSRSPYNFKLRYVRSEAVSGPTTSRHVSFVNLDGAGFLIGPNAYITIQGGDWGPNTCAGEENKIGPDGNIAGQIPRHIVLDGLYIHDQNGDNPVSGCHFGGLFVISGRYLVLRRTRFSQNVVYDVQVQNFTNAYPDVRGFVIQNNWFGAPVGWIGDTLDENMNDRQPELQLDPRHGCWRDFLIRFNSFHNGVALGFDARPCFDNVRVIGNVGDLDACYRGASGLRIAYNAWRSGRCRLTDTRIYSLPYVSTTIGNENFHLTTGRALNLVPWRRGDYALRRDIDGQRRPHGPRSDAGADEKY
jgi:hypothetical protein